MKVDKFNENNDYVDYGYDWNDHVFVLARPKEGWFEYHGTFGLEFKNDEFVPCMITGEGYAQRIWYIGNQYGHQLKDFDIIEGSHKGFKDLIELHSSVNKYNL